MGYLPIMKRFQLPALLVALALVAGLVNILILEDLADIRTGGLALPPGEGAPEEQADRPVIRIGVVSRFAPNVIYNEYQPIMEYLEREGFFRYELQLSSSYQDAVDRLREGRVDASFLGAWIYSHLADDEDLVPIMAPLNAQGLSEFHAVLVTRAGSGLFALADLEGRRVALPSPQSFSGNWLQSNGLKESGLVPADLDTLHHFAHHPTVVWQVLRGDFDAGVVKESVATKFADEGLRRVAVSQAIPGPPLVGRRDLNPDVLAEINRLLLNLDPDNPEDRKILDSWTPEFSQGFTAVNRDDYRDAFRPEEARQ
jgi:phosphonate transport system substrate-binding protein